MTYYANTLDNRERQIAAIAEAIAESNNWWADLGPQDRAAALKTVVCIHDDYTTSWWCGWRLLAVLGVEEFFLRTNTTRAAEDGDTDWVQEEATPWAAWVADAPNRARVIEEMKELVEWFGAGGEQPSVIHGHPWWAPGYRCPEEE